MNRQLKSHSLLFILLIIATLLFLLYLRIQPELTYDFSPLFDGNKYSNAYKYFSGSTPNYSVPFPFHSRILVPFLASLLPVDTITNNFHIINYIFVLASIIAIYGLWRLLGISNGYMMTGFFWLMVHWSGLIRYNIFDPITVDVPIYFFQALLLIIIIKRKLWWLLILGPIATLQKESFIGILFIVLLVSIFKKSYFNYSFKEISLLAAALVISILSKEVVNYYFLPANPDKNSLIVVLFHIKESIIHPFRLIRWGVGAFTAYGPLLLLSIWVSIKNKSINANGWYLIALSGLYMAYSLLAGSDFTRIALLGFPYIMTWILVQTKEARGFLFKISFIIGLPLLKLFSTIPDPAVSGWNSFNKWFPTFANPILVLLWLLYAVLCVLIFWITEKKLSRLP